MKNLLIAVVFVISLSAAYGLQCYQCDGHDSDLKKGDCGDHFDGSERSEMLVTCNATQSFCRKEKVGANHIWTHVERGCAEQCEDQNIAYVKVVKCCKEEKCNSGNLLQPTVALLVSIASFLALKKIL